MKAIEIAALVILLLALPPALDRKLLLFIKVLLFAYSDIEPLAQFEEHPHNQHVPGLCVTCAQSNHTGLM